MRGRKYWKNGLPDRSLDFLILNRTVYVTTQQKARERFFVVTYNVSDLITAGHTPEALQEMLERLHGCAWDCDEPGTGEISICRELMVVSQTQRSHALIEDVLNQLRWGEIGEEERLFTMTYRVLSPDQLTRGNPPCLKSNCSPGEAQVVGKPSDTPMLQEQDQPGGAAKETTDFAQSLAEALPPMVAPESWEAEGGLGSIRSVPGAIIVRQTPEVHRQLRKVLEPFLPPPFAAHYPSYSANPHPTLEMMLPKTAP